MFSRTRRYVWAAAFAPVIDFSSVSSAYSKRSTWPPVGNSTLSESRTSSASRPRIREVASMTSLPSATPFSAVMLICRSAPLDGSVNGSVTTGRNTTTVVAR